MNKSKWFEAYSKVQEFESGHRTGKELEEYVQYMSQVMGVRMNVCLSCSGSIHKAHCDFQNFLFRKAIETKLNVLPEVPELKGTYASDFWKTSIGISNFHILSQLVSKLNSEYAYAIKHKLNVDDAKYNYDQVRQYLLDKRDIKPTKKVKSKTKHDENNKGLLQDSTQGTDTGLSEVKEELQGPFEG